jgi:hypothetical protein
MYNTVAEFISVKGRPRRRPDYVSRNKRTGEVSSEYWYTDDGVIRGSSHWGEGVASCDWGIEGIKGTRGEVTKTSKLYGYAPWEEFTQKTVELEEGVLSNFENTIGKGYVLIGDNIYDQDNGEKTPVDRFIKTAESNEFVLSLDRTLRTVVEKLKKIIRDL